MSREKKVLEELLEAREDNLIRLHFDRYFGGVIYKKEKTMLVEGLVKIDGEIAKVNKALDSQRELPKKSKDREKITRLETQLRGGGNRVGLFGEKADVEGRINKIEAEIKKTEVSIDVSNEMIKVLKECIKSNPKQIYEWRTNPSEKSSTRGSSAKGVSDSE